LDLESGFRGARLVGLKVEVVPDVLLELSMFLKEVSFFTSRRPEKEESC